MSILFGAKPKKIRKGKVQKIRVQNKKQEKESERVFVISLASARACVSLLCLYPFWSAKRGHTYSRGQICALFKLSCVRAARSMYSKNSFSIYLSRADAIRSEYARILKRGWTLTTRRRVLSSRNCSRTWRPAYREKRGTFPTYPPSLGRRFLYHQRFRRLRR